MESGALLEQPNQLLEILVFCQFLRLINPSSHISESNTIVLYALTNTQMTIISVYISMENSTCVNKNQLRQVRNNKLYKEKLGCHLCCARKKVDHVCSGLCSFIRPTGCRQSCLGQYFTHTAPNKLKSQNNCPSLNVEIKLSFKQI